MKNKTLINYLAQSCHYAQEHIGDFSVWSKELADREKRLGCTSYQVACFISQNTIDGHLGVDWHIILDELIETTPAVKTVEQWETIIADKASLFGGWK